MPKAPTPVTIEVPKTFVMPDGTEHVVTPIEPTAEDFNVFVADESDRKTSHKVRRTLGALLLVGAAVGTTLVVTHHSDEAPLSSDATEQTTTTGVTETTLPMSPDTAKTFYEDVSKVFTGFQAGQLVAGNDVNFQNNPEERGASAFSTKTLASGADISNFFNSDDVRAQTMVAKMKEDLKDNPEAFARAMRGEGYVPVQALVPVNIVGTSYFKDGKSVDSDHNRMAGAGDIFWIAYDPATGHVIWDAFVRADCGNAHVKSVTPVQPGVPTTPIENGPQDNPKIPTPVTTVPYNPTPKYDNGKLPGNPNVPADQDHGTPDVAGEGSAGQTPDAEGYLPEEPKPSVAPAATEKPRSPSTTDRPTATTSPQPKTTNPPAPATTSAETTIPQNQPIPTNP